MSKFVALLDVLSYSIDALALARQDERWDHCLKLVERLAGQLQAQGDPDWRLLQTTSTLCRFTGSFAREDYESAAAYARAGVEQSIEGSREYCGFSSSLVAALVRTGRASEAVDVLVNALRCALGRSADNRHLAELLEAASCLDQYTLNHESQLKDSIAAIAVARCGISARDFSEHWLADARGTVNETERLLLRKIRRPEPDPPG